MPFEDDIRWESSSDPERPGHRIWTGAPQGLPEHQIIVQDVGDSEWGWLLMNEESSPVQMRNGYVSHAAAMDGARFWLQVNPEA